MADEKSTGTSIVFKVDDVAVGGETECSFSINGAEIDVSSKSSGNWKEFLAGRADWTASGSAMILFDSTADTLSAAQKALYTAITTKADVEIEIALTDTLVFEGTAFFTSFEGSFGDEAAGTLSWAVRGKGALTLTEGE